ncbi:hypothetical protein SDC9_132338 [bioreactor metagenome]|uniref:Uncharacterized protein n=1 Tax=bioreactor metagenome TaxID=1076179 RepID=A0A645D6V8_9ZZZZ
MQAADAGAKLVLAAFLDLLGPFRFSQMLARERHEITDAVFEQALSKIRLFDRVDRDNRDLHVLLDRRRIMPLPSLLERRRFAVEMRGFLKRA